MHANPTPSKGCVSELESRRLARLALCGFIINECILQHEPPMTHASFFPMSLRRWVRGANAAHKRKAKKNVKWRWLDYGRVRRSLQVPSGTFFPCVPAHQAHARVFSPAPGSAEHPSTRHGANSARLPQNSRSTDCTAMARRSRRSGAYNCLPVMGSIDALRHPLSEMPLTATAVEASPTHRAGTSSWEGRSAAPMSSLLWIHAPGAGAQ